MSTDNETFERDGAIAMQHNEPHALAGQTVTLNESTSDVSGELQPGTEYRIEDYWDRVSGGSWMNASGNPACLKFAMRSGLSGGAIPTDDEVVYGKVNGIGHLVHVSELGAVVGQQPMRDAS